MTRGLLNREKDEILVDIAFVAPLPRRPTPGGRGREAAPYFRPNASGQCRRGAAGEESVLAGRHRDVRFQHRPLGVRPLREEGAFRLHLA